MPDERQKFLRNRQKALEKLSSANSREKVRAIGERQVRESANPGRVKGPIRSTPVIAAMNRNGHMGDPADE